MGEYKRKTTTYGSVSGAIRELLREGPKTVREMAAHLGKHSQDVTPWLYRLQRQGEVRKVSNASIGRYGDRSSLWKATNLKRGRTAEPK
jgi:predicted ArsR family transcriptional regulator